MIEKILTPVYRSEYVPIDLNLLELKHTEVKTQEIFKKIITNSNVIGYGDSAYVYRNKELMHQYVCKVFSKINIGDINFDEERKIGNDVSKIFPHDFCTPYTYAVYPMTTNKSQTIITMVQDYVNGCTIEDILQNYEKIEVLFSQRQFFEALNHMLEVIHFYGIYHRDLHERNVMVNYKTGMPVIIDWGKSKRFLDKEENPYLVINSNGTISEFFTDTENFDNLKKFVSFKLRKYS